uniref:C2H2-type domain-containing protein n=1 Tax=Haemonchus contortus TaxID=6289 RepID=A0A7I4Y0R6_HAECO
MNPPHPEADANCSAAIAMDLNYMQLLAAAAATPTAPPFTSIGQQPLAFNQPTLLQNPWLQQQYYQRLALQQYLGNVRTPVSISPLILPTLATTSLASSKPDDNIRPRINATPVPIATSYTPSGDYGLVAPAPKRARLVLPTISDEDQKRKSLLEEQPHIASLPTQAVQAEPPVASTHVLPSTFTSNPSYRTSPSTETGAEVGCSPSTSVDAPVISKEDEEPELFIDIESVDNRPEGRDRRRAYIDFYRKVKSARQRESGPLLNCALCDCQVLSNDNAIHAHVNHHAEAGGFWCKLCGLSECDKYRIYEHMRVNHPNNIELFEDRRDILKLCAVIQECFPRASPRFKKETVREFDLIIKTIEEKHLTEVKCGRCDALVKATKTALTRHAHQHPVYRCKVCKFTSENIKTQEEHQVGLHTSLDPKITVDYNVCSAADVLARTVQRCFAHVLQSSDMDGREKNSGCKSSNASSL